MARRPDHYKNFTVAGVSGNGQRELVEAVAGQREISRGEILVDGMRPKDIAKLLDISPKTVDTYRSNIMRKLGIHDLVGLVKFAINRNLTSVSNPQVPS